MRIFLTLLLTFYIFPADVEGLREIQVGDKIPVSGELKFIEGQGKTIILCLKSDDLRSVAFMKQFLKSYSSGKKTSFFLIDMNAETDRRVMLLFDKLNGNKKIMNDPQRKIYGELGVVVMPSLLYIDEAGILNSVIVGYRPNLAMFFKSHLSALIKGEKPGDVYEETDKKLAQRKKNRASDQAFALIIDGNYQLAGIIYKKSTEKDPGNEEAMLGYGYALLMQGKIKEALTLFSEAVKSSESKRIKFGYYLSLASGDPSEDNLTNLSRFALLEPSFFPAVFEAAEVLQKNGKLEQSNKVFTRSYRILLRMYRRNK